MQSIDDSQTARTSTMAFLAKVVIGVLVVLLVIDIALRLLLPQSILARYTIDIQKPSSLFLKLEDVRAFKGRKVVILGDSLIFGRTMRDKGDAEWQQHTLSTQLQRWLEQRYPGEPFLVANLGMNGTLPADLEQMVRIVAPLQPDLLLFDLSLRSFSRDFESEAGSKTRSWLADLTLDGQGGYATNRTRAGLNRTLEDWAIRYWYLYRIRDYLQAILFDGEPSTFALATRNAIDGWFRHGSKAAKPSSAGDLDDIVLLMRARSRYAGIDLKPDNPQRQALERILLSLKAQQQPAIVFYATENPEMLPELLLPAHFAQLQNDFLSVMAPTASPMQVFVGPQPKLPPSSFLDHVHLNRSGYAQLAGILGEQAAKVLEHARTAPPRR